MPCFSSKRAFLQSKWNTFGRQGSPFALQNDYYCNANEADCWLGSTYVVELFSFPNPPVRPSYPEAAGLRHLAFEVDNLAEAVDELDCKGIVHEPIRTDEYTGKRFVFFSDPDKLPIELYEK